MNKTYFAAFMALMTIFSSQAGGYAAEGRYAYKETNDLVALVNDAAALVASEGEEAFKDFRIEGSKWRRLSTYIFHIAVRIKYEYIRALSGGV